MLVQLLNLPLLLFVQLSLLVQLASKGKQRLLLVRVQLLWLLFVQLSLLVQLAPKEGGCSCSCSSFLRGNGCCS